MASPGSESPKFVRALRRMRPVLTRELPKVVLLLNRAELKPCFTKYESNTILSQSLPSQQAEKFIEILEFKSYDVYQKFLCVLKELRTDLAVRLEGMEREVSAASTASNAGSNQASPEHNMMNGFSGEPVRMVAPVQESYYNHHQEQLNDRVRADDGQGERGQETAGIYGLSGNARNNFHHLRDLSYAGREYLAEHLNGVPPERHIFHRFCDALGVERRLVQAATRSRNPTAYLIQEYAQKDEDATFQRLEVALDMVGKRDLYVGLYDKLVNGGFDDDDECN